MMKGTHLDGSECISLVEYDQIDLSKNPQVHPLLLEPYRYSVSPHTPYAIPTSNF